MVSPSQKNVIVFLVVALALNVMDTNVLILTSQESPSKLPNIMCVSNKKEQRPLPEVETPTVATMAMAGAEASQQEIEEDETLDHVLCQSTANPHASINNN